MIKHRRIFIGVFFVVLAFAFVIYIGVQKINFSPETVTTDKNETIAPTTTGEECVSADEMGTFYGIEVNYHNDSSTVTISVKNGTFKVGSVYATDSSYHYTDVSNLISTDMNSLGYLSKEHPYEIASLKSANGSLTIHLVLAESDSKCLAYDSATTNSLGEKVGTYQTDIRLDFKPKKDKRDEVANSNYNGICEVFRTGQKYDQYKDLLNKAGVSKSDITNYHYTAVNSDQQITYNSIIPYCTSNAPVTFNYTEAQTASLIASAINIIKSSSSLNIGNTVSESFMTAFNDAKSKALNLGHDYSSYVQNGSLENLNLGTLTCAWDKKATDDDYYVNKDYYYAKSEDVQNINYTYHYTSGNTASFSGGSCSRICEEAVVVEYGPPVASKAGLCFEYKVRVTSRVVCNSSLKLTPPTTPSVCTPTPFCQNVTGDLRQGGPNDEFDSCILDCDGGKYTDSCSQKCYEKVYGDDSASYDPLSIRYGDATVKRVEYANPFPGYDGRYDWQGDSIIWNHAGEKSTYARWYLENEADLTYNQHDFNDLKLPISYYPNIYYVAGADGFKRANYSTGTCNDPCSWTGCSKDSYLNDEDAAKDSIKNLDAYNAAIATCSAAASCTTKTAHFTISVDYTDGKGKKQTKEFPLSSSGVSSATLPSHGEGVTSSPSGTEIFIPELTVDPTDEDGYAGCYDDGSAKNWYQAAWSFPGTWINNKTGEISFTRPSNEKAWHYKEDKFCIPLDAQSVNVNWWQWSQIKNSCYSGNGNDITYNIHASTTDFGYFGWDFDIKCFYALKNEVCVPDSNGCCSDNPNPGGGDDDDDADPPTTISTKDYAFRIVDLNNLFPEGKNSTNANSSKLSSTGRQPGYNWTLDMTNTDASILTSLNSKNPNYKVDPLALINSIQTKGDAVYNDDYLDYEITLDTEALRDIRNSNKKKSSYTEYSGKTTDKNGVTSYVSDLLDDLGSAVGKRGTPGINNEGKGAN